MSTVRIALTKGRLEKESVKIFEAIGITSQELRNKGRKIILRSDDGSLEFILVKASDVITYVEHGAADMGIVGKDTILEEEGDFFEVMDLGIGRCKFSVAAIKDQDIDNTYKRKRIATKYPNVATKYYNSINEDVEIIKINGSVEIAPILGLADAIVDIVETGKTLKENGLEVAVDICDISARIIVNKAKMKTKKREITGLLKKLEAYIEGEESTDEDN